MNTFRTLAMAMAGTVWVLASCGNSGNDKGKKKDDTNKAELPVLAAPLFEEKCAKLFAGSAPGEDFEASGIHFQQGALYVIFDNMRRVGKIGLAADGAFGPATLGEGKKSSSDYEGIAGDGSEGFYVIAESGKPGLEYQPFVHHYNAALVQDGKISLRLKTRIEGAGFEGIAYTERDGKQFLLCLNERNGLIVVFEKTADAFDEVATMELPVRFKDYSDIALSGLRMAVTSQENSRLWIGSLRSDAWQVADSGKVYRFPVGSKTGEMGNGKKELYANIEGVTFINDSTLATCTDRVKASQPEMEAIRDQSVQVFRLR